MQCSPQVVPPRLLTQFKRTLTRVVSITLLTLAFTSTAHACNFFRGECNKKIEQGIKDVGKDIGGVLQDIGNGIGIGNEIKYLQSTGINTKLAERGIQMFDPQCLFRIDGKNLLYKGGCFTLIEYTKIIEHEGFINEIENDLGDYLFSKTIEEWIEHALPRLPSPKNPSQLLSLDEYYSTVKEIQSGNFSKQIPPNITKLLDSALNIGSDVHNLIYMRQKQMIPIDDGLLISVLNSGLPTPSVPVTPTFPEALDYLENKTIPAFFRGYSLPLQAAAIARFPLPGVDVPWISQFRIGFPLAMGSAVHDFRSNPLRAATESTWLSGNNGGYFHVTLSVETGPNVDLFGDAYKDYLETMAVSEFTMLLKCPIQPGNCQLKNMGVQFQAETSIQIIKAILALKRMTTNQVVREALGITHTNMRALLVSFLGERAADLTLAMIQAIYQAATRLVPNIQPENLTVGAGNTPDPIGLLPVVPVTSPPGYSPVPIEPPGATPPGATNTVSLYDYTTNFCSPKLRPGNPAAPPNFIDRIMGSGNSVAAAPVSLKCYWDSQLIQFMIGATWINPDSLLPEPNFIPGYKIHSDSQPDLELIRVMGANRFGVDLRIGNVSDPAESSLVLRARFFPFGYIGLQWPQTDTGRKATPTFSE